MMEMERDEKRYEKLIERCLLLLGDVVMLGNVG